MWGVNCQPIAAKAAFAGLRVRGELVDPFSVVTPRELRRIAGGPEVFEVHPLDHLPIAHVEVSIQDDAGRLLGAREIGEVCVRGGNVMIGYWNQPEETAKAMRNGWLLTGDIGYRDGEGYYFITDRKKDMLLVNGINVYPREIEEVMYQFPGVKEAAVIGKLDARRGEQPIAFVAANEGEIVEETALRHFLRKRLADYKVPRKVVVLPSLPRNATGKILKTVLRNLPIAEESA